MKAILLLLFITVFSITRAQDTTANNYWSVKLGVAPSPDIAKPYFSINTAVQKRSGRYAYQAQVNILLPYSYSLNDTVNNAVTVNGKCYGFSLRAEFRKFRSANNHKHTNKNVYWGAELFFTRYNTARSGEYGNLNDTAILHTKGGYNDAFLLKKSIVGTSLLAGIQRRLGKHFLIDFNFGLGIKFKNIEASQKLNDEDANTYRHAEFTNLADRIGFSVALSLPVNFSIGYTF
jgi:hypothetical protein